MYRVREKGNGTFALSISHHGVTKHYRIDKRRTSAGEKLAIESGPQFDNLMDVSRNFIMDCCLYDDKKLLLFNCCKLLAC